MVFIFIGVYFVCTGVDEDDNSEGTNCVPDTQPTPFNSQYDAIVEEEHHVVGAAPSNEGTLSDSL